MLRRLHSIVGLCAALLVMLLAISGAVLSVNPALERWSTNVPAAGQLNVAQLASRIAAIYPGAEQLQRSPAGTLIVYYSQAGQPAAQRIDPLSGQALGAYEPSEFSVWVKNLHRSLLLDDTGRAIAGLGALAMLLLSISGALMLAKRLGGWAQLLRPLRGTGTQRWHSQAGRLSLLGLLLSALTALYLSASTFALVSDGMQNQPAFPRTVAGAVAKGFPPSVPAILSNLAI